MEEPIIQEQGHSDAPLCDEPQEGGGRFRALACLAVPAVLYLLAVMLIHLPPTGLLQREEVRIAGPGGKSCLGTLWKEAGTPAAVLVAGHGVTANRGIMAMIAHAFTYNGYAVLALDFWGHGRSREAFDWHANPDQVRAWCSWARERFPGVPLIYLGYSMGGFAGAEAFREDSEVDAFVALGALPRHELQCPTLVASGLHEELFTPDQARQAVNGWGKTVTSPWSDHVLEAHDPVLIGHILSWANATLKITPPVRVSRFGSLIADRGTTGRPGASEGALFPWLYWGLFLFALLSGSIAALMVAGCLLGLVRLSPAPPAAWPVLIRSWSVNPYRVIGGAFRCHGPGAPPRAGGLWSALIRGIGFSVLLVLLLTGLLNRHVFTCFPDHPERLLTWLVLIPVLTVPMILDARMLERLPFSRSRKRFAVAALTRGIPFLVAGVALRALGPPAAFSGMIVILFALIFVLISLVHTLATRACADWRSGAVASIVFFAWLIAFWFPLSWPWVGVFSGR